MASRLGWPWRWPGAASSRSSKQPTASAPSALCNVPIALPGRLLRHEQERCAPGPGDEDRPAGIGAASLGMTPAQQRLERPVPTSRAPQQDGVGISWPAPAHASMRGASAAVPRSAAAKAPGSEAGRCATSVQRAPAALRSWRAAASASMLTRALAICARMWRVRITLRHFSGAKSSIDDAAKASTMTTQHRPVRGALLFREPEAAGRRPTPGSSIDTSSRQPARAAAAAPPGWL